MSWGLSLSRLANSFTKISLGGTTTTVRPYIRLYPRHRPPKWHVQKAVAPRDELITHDNKLFIKEAIQDRLAKLEVPKLITPTASESPLNQELPKPVEWCLGKRRVGLIGKKLGHCLMWNKKGKRVPCTLIQIVENQVVKFITPEETERVKRKMPIKHRKAIMLVGSETVDPTQITREYYGIFEKSGVAPKRHLHRFFVTPDAQLPPGTPLTATHFRVGDRVDIRGLTVNRGFQGVMKRWGFKGMPKTHGVTKTHRRPGNIGSGGGKARVWPGQKMPGHMGNKWKILKGVTILRINTKYNVLWCEGLGLAGKVGGLLYLYDTILPNRQPTTPLPYPTYFETGNEEENIYHESIHPFDAPTIEFQPE